MSRNRVDWAQLARDLGGAPVPARATSYGLLLGDPALPTTLTATSISGDVAREAVCHIIGDQVWRDSVHEYVTGQPHHELIRGVLRLLKPGAAATECRRIRREGIGDERSLAVELLRHVATRMDLEVLPDLLTDPDPQVRAWAIPLVRELWWDSQIVPDDVTPLLTGLADNPQNHVRELLQELHDLLHEWKANSDPDDTAPAVTP